MNRIAGVSNILFYELWDIKVSWTIVGYYFKDVIIDTVVVANAWEGEIYKQAQLCAEGCEGAFLYSLISIREKYVQLKNVLNSREDPLDSLESGPTHRTYLEI